MWVLMRYNIATLRVQMPDEDFEIITRDSSRRLQVASKVINDAIEEGKVNSPEEQIQFYSAVPDDASTRKLEAAKPVAAATAADQKPKCNTPVPPGASKENKAPESPFKWTTSSIKLMLHLRFEMDETFNRPSTKKIKLWGIIADEMTNKGYEVNALACDSKFRNMKSTFTGINTRLGMTGHGTMTGTEDEEDQKEKLETITWEWYSTFKENIGHKACIDPNEGLLGSTFGKDKSNEQATSGTTKRSNDDKSSGTFLKGKKKRAQKEPELTVKQYLHKKTEKEQASNDKKLEMQQKRLQLQEEMIKVQRERTATLALLAHSLNNISKTPAEKSAPSESPSVP